MKQDRVRTDVLEIAYEEHGPTNGPPVILLHGFPYDVRAFDEVAPPLAADGCRVLVPWLRGYGPTRFLTAIDPALGRAGGAGSRSHAVHGQARHRRAALAGYDWGGRAACIVAALWPERVRCLVSCTGYNIQDIAAFGESRAGRAGASLLVPVLLPHRARAGRPDQEPPRHLPSPVDSCGRRNGGSTRRPSRRARRRSTIPTSSMS